MRTTPRHGVAPVTGPFAAGAAPATDGPSVHGVVLLCGPVGAGKSTVAAALVERGLEGLSLDEVAWAAGHTRHPLPVAAWRAVRGEVGERLVDLVRSGRSVVLDTAAPFRSERDGYRAMLASLGVEPLLAYVRTDAEEAASRVRARAGSGPHDLYLDEATVAAYHAGFEAPTPAEGPLVVVDGAGPAEVSATTILSAFRATP